MPQPRTTTRLPYLFFMLTLTVFNNAYTADPSYCLLSNPQQDYTLLAGMIADHHQHASFLATVDSLDAKALQAAVTPKKQTLLMLAIIGYNATKVEHTQNSYFKIIETLINEYKKYEYPATKRDFAGNTALHYAPNILIAALILSTGLKAIINIENDHAETACDFAVHNGNNTLADFLKDNGAKTSRSCCTIS